jgi:hypothetical protein
MNFRIATMALATMLGTSLLAGPGMAQADLRASVETELQNRQVTVANLDELNEPQLRQIQAVLRGAEHQSDIDNEIERIAGSSIPCLANDQMRSEVSAQLSAMGMDVDVDALSGVQVAEVYLVLACDECSKDSRIQQIVAEAAGERVGDAQLKAEVGSCLRRMGIDLANLDDLTPQQVAEIELVVGAGGNEAEMRDQVQRIVEQ